MKDEITSRTCKGLAIKPAGQNLAPRNTRNTLTKAQPIFGVVRVVSGHGVAVSALQIWLWTVRRWNCGVARKRKGVNHDWSTPCFFWRRRPDLNRGIKVLQTSALPLGYDAICYPLQPIPARKGKCFIQLFPRRVNGEKLPMATAATSHSARPAPPPAGRRSSPA